MVDKRRGGGSDATGGIERSPRTGRRRLGFGMGEQDSSSSDSSTYTVVLDVD